MLAHTAFWEPDDNNCILLKASKSKQLFRCPLDPDRPNTFYLIKIYFYPGILETIKYIFRPSKGYRELSMAAEVSKKGIPTIVPKKVKDIGRFGILHKSAVLMEQIPGAVDLEDLLIIKKVPNAAMRRKIIEEYGKLARLIHDQGIYQDDFDPNNILYQDNQNGTFQLYFLDFERTRLVKNIPFEKRIHSLAKLNRMGRRLKKTDQLRFLKAYLGPEAAKEDRRKWVKRITHAEEKVFSRDQRRAWKECTSTSSRIGFIKYHGYQGYYRKKHHSHVYYSRSDMIRVIQAIEASFSFNTSRPGFSNSIKNLTVALADKEETFQIRFFEYRGLTPWRLPRLTPKTPLLEAWQADNGCLKNRAADFLPVAALAKKTAFTQYQGFLVRKG